MTTEIPRLLKWQFRSTRDSEFATFMANGVKVSVQDCDGDRSVWRITRGKETLAEGESSLLSPYHMDVAMFVAAAAFLELAHARKFALRWSAAGRRVERNNAEEVQQHG